MLIDMAVMDEVQMAIMQVIPMIAVPDPGMPAIIAVNMGMIGMDVRGVGFRCASARS